MSVEEAKQVLNKYNTRTAGNQKSNRDEIRDAFKTIRDAGYDDEEVTEDEFVEMMEGIAIHELPELWYLIMGKDVIEIDHLEEDEDESK